MYQYTIYLILVLLRYFLCYKYKIIFYFSIILVITLKYTKFRWISRCLFPVDIMLDLVMKTVKLRSYKKNQSSTNHSSRIITNKICLPLSSFHSILQKDFQKEKVKLCFKVSFIKVVNWWPKAPINIVRVITSLKIQTAELTI